MMCRGEVALHCLPHGHTSTTTEKYSGMIFVYSRSFMNKNESLCEQHFLGNVIYCLPFNKYNFAIHLNA